MAKAMATVAVLVVLHLCGADLLPVPITVTLCAMQLLSMMDTLTQLPQKLPKDAASPMAMFQAEMRSIIHTGMEALTGIGWCAHPLAGFAVLASLGRILRMMGFFGSAVHLASVACTAIACGGVTFLGYLLAAQLCGSVPRQEDLQACGRWHKHEEEACLTGAICPYSRDFWLEEDHHLTKQVAPEDEDCTFMANLCSKTDEDFDSFAEGRTEDCDGLVEDECRLLIASLH